MENQNSNGSGFQVAIIGAGPSGCMLSLLLANQGAQVSIYDSRKDQAKEEKRLNGKVDQRSINLAISTRGLTALKRVNLDEEVLKISVPMHSRCIHLSPTNIELHPYGQENQFLLSVSRYELTSLLQREAIKHPNIRLLFNHKCVNVDLEKTAITLQDMNTLEMHVSHPTLVVGADGTFSKVRSAMSRLPMFNFSQQYIPCSYKELSFIPSTSSNTIQSQHPLMYYPNALHIWPRREFMLIALPNHHYDRSTHFDSTERVKSFTATLFMKPDQFEELGDDGQEIERFFKKHFPDALPSLPRLVEDFKRNPTAPLLTIRCFPFNHLDRFVLIGDAAHAIVPFYGQGCNASMEDTVVLSDLIAKYGFNNILEALRDYSKYRKPDVDAIADLAIDHFHDMSSRSVSSFHIVKRKFEIFLNKLAPSYFQPLYSLISFSNVPYQTAVEKATSQDLFLSRTIIAIGASSILATASATVLYIIKKSQKN